MLSIRQFCLCSVLALATAPAVAQDAGTTDYATILDTLTVSLPNRTETPVSESTVSVTVVDEEEIAKQEQLSATLSDVLEQNVPGFGQSAGSLSEYGQSMRGRNFLTLIDGVPQTNTLNNNYRSLNSISLSAVRQIEVVRGAAASYGFGAPGGLVNIITKAPEEEGFRVSYESGIRFQEHDLGDSLAYTGGLTASGREGDLDFLVSGSYESTGSSFTADGERRPPDAFGSQGGLDDVDAYDVLAKLGYQFGASRFDVSLNVYDYKQDSNWAGAVGGGSRADNTSATPSWGNLNTETPGVENLTLNGVYENEEVFGSSLKLQAYYNANTTTFTRTEYASIVYPQYETESDKFGGRLTMDTPLYAINDGLNLIWGLDYLHDKTVVNDIDQPSGTPDATLDGIAPFAQLDWEVGLDTQISAGVRYEYQHIEMPTFVNTNGVTVTGGNVTISEPLFNISASHDLNAYASIFAGFSQGSQLGGLVRYAADNNVGSVDALAGEAQKTNSYEAGVRFAGDSWDFTTTGFVSTSNNGSTYTADLDLVLAPEIIYGVEFAGNYEVQPGLEVGGTLTLLNGEYDTDGDGSYDSDLGTDRIAPPKLTAYVDYAPNDWSSYRLQGMLSGSRDPDSDQAYGLQTIEPYFVLDALAEFEVGPGTLSLGVENVLNADYVPALQQAYSVAASSAAVDYYYVKGPGRTFSVSYKGSF